MDTPQTSSAKTPLELRRIGLYLAFAYGIAWAFGLIIALTGGIANSPPLIAGTPFTLALVLLAIGYMGAPALANVLTRLVTREGWRETSLRPQLRQGWPYWLAAWFLPALLTIVGAVLFFAFFPRFFDPELGMLRNALDQATQTTGQPIPFSPWVLVIIQTGVGVAIAPLLNGLFTFGEEFGWRAYLLPKLLPLGERRALLISGLIWGVWHWPVIAMGHNYGLVYPGAPWSGMLATAWVMLVLGVFLGWATLRGGSVWPAVIGHAAINGISGLAILFTRGEPNPLLGPLPVGLIGSAGWAALALWILLRRAAPRGYTPHAIPPPDGFGPLQGASTIPALPSAVREQALRQLTAAIARHPHGAVPITPVVTHGHVAEEIIDEAAQRHADLIVMATHGWGGLRRWALGGVANKVLHATTTPLLLVRSQA